MEIVKYRLGFSNGLIVPSRGRRGGLALLWSRDTNLEIKSFQIIILMQLLLSQAMVFCGGLQGFMGIRKPISGKNLGKNRKIQKE